MLETVKVGDRIKFLEEKQSYKVVARNWRFLICIKPFNARKTYLYSIVDVEQEMRGADYWILGRFDYEDSEDQEQALKELMSGETQLSRRRSIPLKVEKVINA